MAKLKPNKPYPNFPLTAYPNGQWCKKSGVKFISSVYGPTPKPPIISTWPKLSTFMLGDNLDYQWYQRVDLQSRMYAITFFSGK